MIIEDKGHASIDDPIRRNPVDDLRGAGGGSRGRGKGRGLRWAKGLLIRRISEEGPISNIKDESDRSKDDPRKIRRDPSNDRSQRRKVLRLPRRSEDRMVIRLDPRYGSIILKLSLDLVSRRVIPECAHERERLLMGQQRRLVTCKSRLGW